jgi:hypothetical protein
MIDRVFLGIGDGFLQLDPVAQQVKSAHDRKYIALTGYLFGIFDNIANSGMGTPRYNHQPLSRFDGQRCIIQNKIRKFILSLQVKKGRLLRFKVIDPGDFTQEIPKNSHDKRAFYIKADIIDSRPFFHKKTFRKTSPVWWKFSSAGE